MAYYFSYDAFNIYEEMKAFLPLNDLSQIYEEDNFHCTLLYVKSDYQTVYSSFNIADKEFKIKKVEVWADRDGGSYLVALLDDSLNDLQNIHNELKLMTNCKETKSLIPHVSLQKENHKNDLLKPEKFDFLIGKTIKLTNFKCLLPGGVNPLAENVITTKKLNK